MGWDPADGNDGNPVLGDKMIPSTLQSHDNRRHFLSIPSQLSTDWRQIIILGGRVETKPNPFPHRFHRLS